MGNTWSKKEKKEGFLDGIKSNVANELNTRMMIQREVQMSVNIAMARDNIFIFGNAWLALVSGVGFAKAMGKPVPGFVGVPILVGGLMLGNLADMAYGNKMVRIAREAEFIMENERPRLVPPKQAPMAGLYSSDERDIWFDQATPVGDLFPNNIYSRRFVPKKKEE